MASRTLKSLLPAETPRLLDVRLDWRVVAFTSVVALWSAVCSLACRRRTPGLAAASSVGADRADAERSCRCRSA